MPPTPTPRFKREWLGFLFWSLVPPLRTLSTATPSLAPKRESEGVSSCLSCPLQCLPPPRPASMPPGLRTASTPLACVPRQCPRPARRINTPGLCAASTPPACAPRQRPQPARCVDAPSLRAASTLPPFPCTPCLCIDTLSCARGGFAPWVFPLPSFSLR